jgi:hypothetical protein
MSQGGSKIRIASEALPVWPLPLLSNVVGGAGRSPCDPAVERCLALVDDDESRPGLDGGRGNRGGAGSIFACAWALAGGRRPAIDVMTAVRTLDLSLFFKVFLRGAMI